MGDRLMAGVGIIGTGWGTRVQVPRFREAGLEIVALYGRDHEKARRFASENGIEHTVRDWRAMLELDAVDLVTIVTPPFQHLEMATAALEAGKHILTEKPTAMNATEAAQLMEAGERHPSQIALIDHELRFLPSVRAARAEMESIGEVFSIRMRYTSPSRNDPSREWSWWSDASKGGGALGAIGSHLVDLARHLGGEVLSVRGHLETFVDERPTSGTEHRKVTADDFASVDLKLASGAVASIFLSVVTAVDEPTTITIEGSEGGIRLQEDRVWKARVGGEWTELAVEHVNRGPGDSPGGFFGTGTYWIGRALSKAIDQRDRSGLSPGATLFDGYRQQLILDSIRASHDSGAGWVTL